MIYLYLILGIAAWLAIGVLGIIFMQVPWWISDNRPIEIDLTDGNEMMLIAFGPLTLVIFVFLGLIWAIVEIATRWPSSWRTIKLPSLPRSIVVLRARTVRQTPTSNDPDSA